MEDKNEKLKYIEKLIRRFGDLSAMEVAAGISFLGTQEQSDVFEKSAEKVFKQIMRNIQTLIEEK